MYKSAISNLYSKKLAKPVPMVYAVKKFSTNFQPNYTLGSFSIAGSPRNYYAFWSGIDNSTGFGANDIVTFLSAMNGPQLQILNDIDTDVATLPSLYETTIVDAIGPSGNTEKILRFNYKVKSVALNNVAPTQSWFIIFRHIGGGIPPPAINKYYYSVYFKLDPILQTVMKDIVTDANGINWYSIGEMKTGGYGGEATAGDYRYKLILYASSAGKFRYQITGDNVANGLGIVPGVDSYNAGSPYWQQSTPDDIPRFGIWCKLEVFLKRPSSNTDLSTGITWIAVTPLDTGVRQVICNKVGGIQMGAANLPVARIYAAGMYTQAPAPIIGDFSKPEFYDDFPFNPGVRSINNVMYDTVVT